MSEHRPSPWATCLSTASRALIVLTIASSIIGAASHLGTGHVHAENDNSVVERERFRQQPDVFCGPRSVAFVLEYYGRQEQLADLVREMQWPDVELGTSMQAIRDALERRGIHTRAVRRQPGTIVRSTRPVIVHVHPNGDSTRGHFVVWLPGSTNRTVSIWNGLHGLQEIPIERFLSEMSGVVLCTSRNPAEVHGSALVRSTRLRRFVCGPLADMWLVLFPPIGILVTFILCGSDCFVWSIFPAQHWTRSCVSPEPRGKS